MCSEIHNVLHSIRHCKAAHYQWYRLAPNPLSWIQLRSLSTERIPPSRASHCGLIASQGPRQSPYLSHDSTIAASYFKISFKIAARSSYHLTLSPSSGAPVQTVYAFTGNHPEHLGTGSPVWKLQPLCGRWERGSSLLCEDFSTHQALHRIDFGWPRGGSTGGSIPLCSQRSTITEQDMSEVFTSAFAPLVFIMGIVPILKTKQNKSSIFFIISEHQHLPRTYCHTRYLACYILHTCFQIQILCIPISIYLPYRHNFTISFTVLFKWFYYTIFVVKKKQVLFRYDTVILLLLSPTDNWLLQPANILT